MSLPDSPHLSRRSLLLTAPLAAAAFVAAPHRAAAASSLAVPGRPRSAARITPDASTVDAAAAAVRDFSADLYRMLGPTMTTSSTGGNLVCSPYSVAVALAMARAGAMGRTATEMDTVLHAPSPRPTALDAGLNALDQLMVAGYQDGGDGSKRPQLATANSLWAQLGFSLKPAFLSTLADYYGADAHRVDFANATEDARLQINAWVSDHTYGKIPELLAAGLLSPMVKLVLTNAIYLKANWLNSFPDWSTKTAPFRRDDGRVVNVPMMSAPSQDIGYQKGDGWVAVDLPYVGSQLAMAVVMPTDRSLAQLESKMDGAWLTGLLKGFRGASIVLKLPRWKFRLPAELNDILVKLGMPTAFSNEADFSGITAQTRLLIDKVVHQTFIAVDEKGTEAAAASGVIVRPPSVPVSTDVFVDRAFYYVIHDIPRAVPLFVGRVNDPTVS